MEPQRPPPRTVQNCHPDCHRRSQTTTWAQHIINASQNKKYLSSVQSCAGETYEKAVSKCLHGVISRGTTEAIDNNDDRHDLQFEVDLAVEIQKAFSKDVVERLGEIEV